MLKKSELFSGEDPRSFQSWKFGFCSWLSFGDSRFQKAFEEVGNSPNLMEAFGGSSSGMFYGESSHVASPKFLPPSSTQTVPRHQFALSTRGGRTCTDGDNTKQQQQHNPIH